MKIASDRRQQSFQANSVKLDKKQPKEATVPILYNSQEYMQNRQEQLDFSRVEADNSFNCSPSNKLQGLRRGYFLRRCVATFTGREVSHVG